MAAVTVDFGSTTATSPGYALFNSTGGVVGSTRVTAGIGTIIPGQAYSADIDLASSHHTIAWDSTGSGARVYALENLTSYRNAALLSNRTETNSSAGTCVVYQEDDATIFQQSTAYEDYAGTTLYRGNGIERRNRLA